MSGIGMDGTQGFASNLWAMLTDGGVWGVPRCGIVLTKNEQAKTMTVTARMPWHPEMPCTPEQLVAMRDEDIEGVTTMFASIGVIVMPLEI